MADIRIPHYVAAMTSRLGRVLMVQGTASHSGKSTLVTALCRIFAQDGFRVAPFKAQNMSLNAAVTSDGGEIGRAQFAQAEAAGVCATVDMNPILLKPTSEHRSQIIVMGRAIAVEEARAYYGRKTELWPVVAAALDRLRASHDIVIVEGAGSPAEINLAQNDIVNMRVARYADAPVLLVGDIDRGGVFAALYGTVMLLPREERKLIRGYIINKFRGDPTLLAPGFEMMRARTGIPTVGVLPWMDDTGIPPEDSLSLEENDSRRPVVGDVLNVAVIQYPRIANFDDIDPLRREPGVHVRFVQSASSLGDPALIILPGSKATIADLQWLRASGLADRIVSCRAAGTPVIGLCGGYQMLGKVVHDPLGAEADAIIEQGLALLPVTTIFAVDKETHQIEGRVTHARGLLAGCDGAVFEGYELHMGQTSVPEGDSPFRITRRRDRASERAEGMLDSDGLTLGTYFHGIFDSVAIRRAVLSATARQRGIAFHPSNDGMTTRSAAYDSLAALVRRHLDLDAVYKMMGMPVPIRVS